MKKYLYVFLLLFLLTALPPLALTASASAGPAATATGEISTSPATIAIGAQFNGITLEVNGTVPAGSEMVVRLMGAPTELHLRQKGKVFGLLWMNIGQIALKDVPNVFLVDASRPLDELGKAALPYRLQGLADNLEYEKNGQTREIDVPHELLMLKESTGLYNEKTGGVKLGPDEGGKRTFTAELTIPSSLPPGEYKVEAIAVKDGAVAATSVTSIKAELVGFPKSLSDIAFNRSLFYGIMATVIAIVSGLVIGLIFQSKGAH